MKFGITDKEAEEKLCKPFDWYAWHPVRLQDGRWAWLEYVAVTPSIGEYSGRYYEDYYAKD